MTEEKTPQVPKPDSIDKGTINYEIHWYGNEAEFIIDNNEFVDKNRMIMLYQAFNELETLLSNMQKETNKKFVQKNIPQHNKVAVIRSKYLMDKLIAFYLNKIYQEKLLADEKAKKEENLVANSGNEAKGIH